MDELTQRLHEVERDIMSRPPEHNTTNLNLDRMQTMLDIMGHPERSMRIIHVTGTNGKGSTARMAESICRAYGLRTGLYTSPHLEHINERIAIDGQQISDEQFISLWDDVHDLIDLVDAKYTAQGGAPMSFFEVLTAMAIWCFADAPVDVAVVEVGMGGRWDATNVLDADAAIIGPIDMDHMQWLGNSVEAIAGEKAGIIKQGSTVIVGPQPHEEEVMPILEAEAVEKGARVLHDGEEIEVISRAPAVGGQVVSLRTPRGTYTQVPVAKFGEHQAHNALAALTAAECVIPVAGALDGDVVAQALSTVKIPGRLEVIRHSPTILIDGGHNVNAAFAIRDAIEENFDFKHIVAVVSMMADKQVEQYLGVLEPFVDQLIVTENSWKSRVMPAQDLEKIAVRVFGRDRVHVQANLTDAIQEAVDLVDVDDELGVGFGQGILICGSFVTAGDARTLLKEEIADDLKKPKDQRVQGAEPEMDSASDAAELDYEFDTAEDFSDTSFGFFDLAHNFEADDVSAFDQDDSDNAQDEQAEE